MRTDRAHPPGISRSESCLTDLLHLLQSTLHQLLNTMHDLNTINRLNLEAFGAAINNYRAQGRYVLARYEGSTLASIETFSELTHAQWAADENPAVPAQGQRVVIYAPTSPLAGATRDQSEDRKQPYTLDELAALGKRSVTPPAEHTLGDYIARKSVLLDDPAV